VGAEVEAVTQQGPVLAGELRTPEAGVPIVVVVVAAPELARPYSGFAERSDVVAHIATCGSERCGINAVPADCHTLVGVDQVFLVLLYVVEVDDLRREPFEREPVDSTYHMIKPGTDVVVVVPDHHVPGNRRNGVIQVV
jgi:hypothetical protein